MTDRGGSTPPLRVLLDANLAVSVGEIFSDSGHEVIYYNDVLPERVSDHVVAAVALRNNAVVLGHDKDFKRIVKANQFSHLGLILFECNNVLAAKRAEHLMPLIEYEWLESHRKKACRVRISIRPHALFIHR